MSGEMSFLYLPPDLSAPPASYGPMVIDKGMQIKGIENVGGRGATLVGRLTDAIGAPPPWICAVQRIYGPMHCDQP